MNRSVFIYITIAAVVSLLIRALPTTLLRRQIRNSFVRSFLYYVPYVTLSVMTFPAITLATKNPPAGYAALIVGIIVALVRKNLFETAVMCCLTVLLTEFLI
ncbi:MAG: AzlD domain-containing protein [Lachnospiraceae bacterium]|nr:AzlD domain-containing protein [Lachnospiraceae bacterium]